MTADAPTPYELLRAVEQLRKDMQGGFEAVNKRLDRMVTAELFALYQQAMDRRFQAAEKEIGSLEVDAETKIKEIQAERKSDAKERNSEKRWRFGLIVMAGVALLTTFVGVIMDLSRAFS